MFGNYFIPEFKSRKHRVRRRYKKTVILGTTSFSCTIKHIFQGPVYSIRSYQPMNGPGFCTSDTDKVGYEQIARLFCFFC